MYSSLEKIAEGFLDKNIDVVSFDLFDTLVTRPLESEVDIFEMLDRDFGKMNNASLSFKKLRMDAEAALRRRIISGEIEQEDIKLSDIYDLLVADFGIDEETARELMEEEQALEISLCRTRESGKWLWDQALDSGKQVVVISDMYLDKECILDILKENGYNGFHDVYVSSEMGKRKITGNLYRTVSNILRLPPERIFHIGDNEEFDYRIPMEVGYKAALLPSTIKAYDSHGCGHQVEKLCADLTDWEAAKRSAGIGAMRQMAANKYFDNPFREFDDSSDYNADPYFVGYGALGMHLLSLVKWLAENVQRDGINQLIFMARDGYLPKKAYDAYRRIHPELPESMYLHVSRRSLLPAIIREPEDLYDLPVDITYQTPSKLLRLLAFCDGQADENADVKYALMEAKANEAAKAVEAAASEVSDADSAIAASLSAGGVFLDGEDGSSKKKSRTKKKDAKKDDGEDEESFTPDSFRMFISNFIKTRYDSNKHVAAKMKISKYIKSKTGNALKESAALFDMGYSGRIPAAVMDVTGTHPSVYYFHADGRNHFRYEKRSGMKIRSFFDFNPYMEASLREYSYLEATASCIGYTEDLEEIYDAGPAEGYYKAALQMQKGAMDFVEDYLGYFRDYESEISFRCHDAAMPFEAFIRYCRGKDLSIYDKVLIDDELWGGRRDIDLKYLIEARRSKLPEYAMSSEERADAALLLRQEGGANTVSTGGTFVGTIGAGTTGVVSAGTANGAGAGLASAANGAGIVGATGAVDGAGSAFGVDGDVEGSSDNCPEWDTEMKSSPLRESVLNWYEFRKGSYALYVGSEDDVLARLLRRRCKHVECTEASTRPKDAYDPDGITQVLVSEDSSAPKVYDYIICMDGKKLGEEGPALLEEWSKRLYPGGTIIIGADNRYGLRNFCGDETGMDSRDDSMNREGRFSKLELEKMIKDADLPNYKFFYPVPDMRMPQMIFTDEYMNGINTRERLNDYNYHDHPMRVMEHRLFGDVIDGGALPFMSDSYIVEITIDGQLSDIDYAVVTTDRGTEFGMATTIRGGSVVKRPLYYDGEDQLKLLNSYTEELKACGVPVVETSLKMDARGTYLDMPYISYEGMTSVLERLINTDREQFLEIFDAIYMYIRRSSLKGHVFLDLAPCNAFYVPGKKRAEESILFYDQEFVSDDATPEFAMYRAIRYFFESSAVARDAMHASEMYQRYRISEEDRKAFAEKEREFIASVRNTDQFEWVTRASAPNITDGVEEQEKKPYHIGYVPGVFDLFHKGHLRLIERCKERCDILIVGVLTDELVEYYKGRKPVISCEDRMEVIRGLRAVDRVIPVDFSNTDKLDAWDQLHYDCHFSGDDHVGHWNDIIMELHKRGSNMEFFSYTKGVSTTEIREEMQSGETEK